MIRRWVSDSHHNGVAHLLKISLVVTWENVMVEGNVEANAVAGEMMQEFEENGETVPTKTMELTDDCKVVLMPFKKDNERLKAINKQIMPKCKSQNAVVVVDKEVFFTQSRKADTLEQQVEDLIANRRAPNMFECSAKTGLLCKGQGLGKICAMS